MRALVADISRAGIKGDYEESEARILLLLIGLSGRPLDTSLEGAAAAAQRVRERRLGNEAEAEATRARQEAELLALIRAEDSAGDDDIDMVDAGAADGRAGTAARAARGRGARGGRSAGGYASSCSSTVSDWSDDEVEGQAAAAGDGAGGTPGRWAQAAAGAAAASSAPVAATGSGRGASPRGSGQGGAGTGQMAGSSALAPGARQETPSLKYPVAPDPPASVGRQRLPPPRVLAPADSLRARLVGAAGLPLRIAGGTTPLPRTLLALLAALQGRSSELIPWDPTECSFRPRGDLYLAADASYGAMQCAALPLLRAATAIRRLDDWMDVCLGRRHAIQLTAAPGPGQALTAAAGGPTPALTGTVAGTGAAVAGPATASCGAERGFELPAWLVQAAGIRGRCAAGLRLLQGPTLQALHQAVSSCLHALRTPLVQLEQRLTNAACCSSPSANYTAGSDNPPAGNDPPGSLPSLYELLVSCQPYVRRAAGLVAAYLDVTKPLVVQLAAANTGPVQEGAAAAAGGATTSGAAATAATAAAAAVSGIGSGGADGSVTARLRGSGAAAAGAAATAAAGVAGLAAGGPAAGTGPGTGALGGRSVYLQLQAGLVLERLHAMNERGWLDGVFMPLESHAHRCMLLYLYLSALDPLLDGLAEWLWTRGPTGGGGGSGGAAGASAVAAGAVGASAAGAAGSGSSELPADFFIVRGGGPGREVPADHPAFWREGYVALTRPSSNGAPGPTTGTSANAVGATGGPPSIGSGSGPAHGAQLGPPTSGVQSGIPQAGGGAGGGAPGAAAGAAAALAPYLCPPFLEPLVPSIMAAGKSLRLRQREADSMEAAATTTAGAAGPGYAAAGSAVLDPVALEQSYAMYGLSDDPSRYGNAWGSGSSGGGGRDLKRGLMERLMSYLSATEPSQAPLGATLHTILAAGYAAEPAAAFFADAADVAAAAAAGPDAGLDTPCRHLANRTYQELQAPASVAVQAVKAAPAAAGPQAVPSGGGGNDMGAAGGLWSRMASASARLHAMSMGADAPGGSNGPAVDVGVHAPGSAAAVAAAAGGDVLALPSRQQPYSSRGVAAGRTVAAPQPDGTSSPVTPLECGGGAASSATSPDDEVAWLGCVVGGMARERRREEDVEDGALDGTGGGGVAELGGWWPRRCELLLRQTAATEALGGRGCAGVASGGGRSHLAGPWNRMQKLLRAGPRTALAAQRATNKCGLAPAAASRTAPAFAALPGAARGNAHQHPAMDLLLVHACGLALPAAAQTAPAAAGGAGTTWSPRAPYRAPVLPVAGGVGRGGLGVAAQPLGLPHPHELLRRGLVEPLQDRADHVNDALLLKLLGGWGLETRLAALPSVFLLSSPAVRSWADQLVSALLGGMRLGERPLEEQQLEQMLQEALSSAGPDDLLPPANSLVLTMAPLGPEAAAASGAAGGAGGAAAGASGSGLRASVAAARAQEPAKFQAVQELERSVAELERLQLGLAPSWVVALVADARVLRAYSQVLVFMLQLRWVRAALDAAHKATCLAWRERETRAHPNSWPPLRRPGAPQAAATTQPPRHQRSHSAGAGEAGTVATAGVAATAAAAAAAAGHLRGSGSSGSISSMAGAVAPGVVGGRGSHGAPGTAAGGGGLLGAASVASAQLTPRAASARLQSSLAAMVHFMATLEQWVATQLVHDAWVQLEQDLASARSLDDVCSAHSAYTVTLLRRCFRYSGEEGSRHMGAALRKCLDACLRFAAAISSLNGGSAKGMPTPGSGAAGGGGGAPAAPGGGAVGGGSLPNPLAARLHEEALRAADAFSYWLGYLVRFVSTRALMSPSSDLGDLLMRLNYNDCYSAHFMPEELVAQQLAAQHNATAAARGWAACGPGPAPQHGSGAAAVAATGGTRGGVGGGAATGAMPWATGAGAAAGGAAAGGAVLGGAMGPAAAAAPPRPVGSAIGVVGGGGGGSVNGVPGGSGLYPGVGGAPGMPTARPPGRQSGPGQGPPSGAPLGTGGRW